MTKPDFSIVIPAYNEIDALPLLKKAIDQFSATSTISLQFVFVDDGSRDETFSVLQGWVLENATLKIVKLSHNFGSHAAIRAGIYYADADRVMVYSSDMPEPIEDIELFYQGLNEGNELVYSVRSGYKGDFWSRLFSKLINSCIDAEYPAEGILGIAFGNKIKKEMNSDVQSNSSVFFQIFRLGFKRKGLKVSFTDRKAGESKWTVAKKIKLLVDSFVMFSYVPIRVISGIGVIMAAVGILFALGIVVCKLFNFFEFAAGWPTMMSVFLFGFGITNISLGVIAEYLVRTLDAARNIRAFIVDEIIDI